MAEATPTTVIDVRVKNIRPKYANLKQWMADPNNVYIGRRGIVIIDGERFPKEDSVWANPYKVDANNSRADVITAYETYVRKLLEVKFMRTKLNQLRGKTLGCWCHPESCHGDVLIKLLNEIKPNM